MNKYTLLLLSILIAFLSCDGRDRVHKTNKAVLIENKLLNSFSENIKYFPESYAESTTDTILNNGFRVKIKTFTDMENSVLNTVEVDNIKHKHYFREIISEIIVFKNEKQILRSNIDDQFLSVTDKDYIHNGIYVDQLKSIQSNKLHLVASICIPRTVNCLIYNIIINEKGVYQVLKT